MLYFLGGLLLGIAICIITVSSYKRKKTQCDGDLRVVFADEKDPYMFLELDIPIDQVSAKDSLILRVKVEHYPQ